LKIKVPTMQQPLILSFTNDSITLDQAGGKGMNLARTTRGGFPVPPGFILTTAAYQSFVQANRIDTLIADRFPSLDADNPASLEEVSGSIRQFFTSGQIQPELESSILEAYRKLAGQTGDAPVAVRSSATAEDLAGASFAGQQDTYLNVRGEGALLEAIKRCWSSLWTARAIAYRARQGITLQTVALAVVIQHMVPAESAGILFTANPVSGNREEIVIDASWGLGEAIVGSQVVPDHIVVDKGSGKVVSLFVADKSEMTVRNGQGTDEKPVPMRMRRKPTLNKNQVAELTRLGMGIERFYGAPQDIEWCFAGRRFYIVQVRPITTLQEQTVNWKAPGAGLWLHGGGTFEMITEPISPLFETFLLPIFVEVLLQMLRDVGLRDAIPAIPYRVVNGHIYLHFDLHLKPWHMPGIVKDFALHLNSMKDQESEQTRYHQSVAALSEAPFKDLDVADLLKQMDALGQAGMRYWVQIMKVVQVIYRQESAFNRFYHRHLRGSGGPELEIFLRGQKIKPWEAECSMFKLAGLAKMLGLEKAALDAPETLLGNPQWRNALEVHLERFGHQLSSFDPLLPTLVDDPRPALTAIQAYLDGKESPYDRQQRMETEQQAAIAVAEEHLSPGKRREFHRLLGTAQQAARTREDALFDVGLAWTPMRHIALELGRRLAEKNVIDRPEDIFWLRLEEIRTVFASPVPSDSLAELVSERQALNKQWSQSSPPYLLPVGSKPQFWWKWIFPTPELNQQPDAHTLTGLGVSPGKVTAVARVIHSLDEAQSLKSGEILVTRTTTPAWTPLFARLSGLVTDLGGPLAHGSIVAREYGIPAVMGVGNATHSIHDGDTITVDGTAGRIMI
jgi:pyruvate,water dikinase